MILGARLLCIRACENLVSSHRFSCPRPQSNGEQRPDHLRPSYRVEPVNLPRGILVSCVVWLPASRPMSEGPALPALKQTQKQNETMEHGCGAGGVQIACVPGRVLAGLTSSLVLNRRRGHPSLTGEARGEASVKRLPDAPAARSAATEAEWKPMHKDGSAAQYCSTAQYGSNSLPIRQDIDSIYAINRPCEPLWIAVTLSCQSPSRKKRLHLPSLESAHCQWSAKSAFRIASLSARSSHAICGVSAWKLT